MSASARRSRGRPSDGLAVALVIGMFAVGAFAYQAVPTEMVVHYTPPGGVYYGPETLPKIVGLFVIPVLSTIVFGVLRILPAIERVSEAYESVRPYYQACIVLTVGLLCLGQVSLVLLNIVFA